VYNPLFRQHKQIVSHLPKARRLWDLGCGSGIIGTSYYEKYKTDVELVDNDIFVNYFFKTLEIKKPIRNVKHLVNELETYLLYPQGLYELEDVGALKKLSAMFVLGLEQRSAYSRARFNLDIYLKRLKFYYKIKASMVSEKVNFRKTNLINILGNIERDDIVFWQFIDDKKGGRITPTGLSIKEQIDIIRYIAYERTYTYVYISKADIEYMQFFSRNVIFENRYGVLVEMTPLDLKAMTVKYVREEYKELLETYGSLRRRR